VVAECEYTLAACALALTDVDGIAISANRDVRYPEDCDEFSACSFLLGKEEESKRQGLSISSFAAFPPSRSFRALAIPRGRRENQSFRIETILVRL